MFWRTILCLLALSLLILAHPALIGQSAAVHLAPLPARVPVDFTPEHFTPGYIPVPSPIFPSPPARLPTPVSFPGIARAAGTIFSGTVTSIQRKPATRGSAVETVAITFHVENSMRGATPGEDLTISQWIGLWTSGQRYRVGERVLLFLYPPSKLGLTSSVAGPMGRFNVDPWGRVLLSAHHLSAFRTDPVLGGKPRVRVSDFALAVRKACEEE
ncbi:MAG: hypothetical protein WCF26_03695 [Candidatus Sulfotelmatobacter sp.]